MVFFLIFFANENTIGKNGFEKLLTFVVFRENVHFDGRYRTQWTVTTRVAKTTRVLGIAIEQYRAVRRRNRSVRRRA